MDLPLSEMPTGIKPFKVLPANLIRQKSTPVDLSKGVTPEMETVLWRMVKTCEVDNGIGLAAPQVGIFKRLIITKILHRENLYRAYVNPSWKAAFGAERVLGIEGCLSVANRNVGVERFDNILAAHYEFVGGQPEQTFLALDDLSARIFQHECDHLDGMSIIDRRR
jgi:peptide deformylase